MSRSALPAVAFLAALVAASGADAKELTSVAVVRADGSSTLLRPPAAVAEELFDGRRTAEARGGYVRVYPLGRAGHVGIPGRFHPATGALCFSWSQAARPPRRCGLPGPRLERLLRAESGRPRFRGSGPALARLSSPRVRPVVLGNLRAAFELAFDRARLARPARRPAQCVPFTGAWRGAARPERFCLSENGVHARGLLYPLGPAPFRLADDNRR